MFLSAHRYAACAVCSDYVLSEAMRPGSLKDFDDNGLNVRIWCFDCGRGAVVDSIIWRMFKSRGWPDDLASATRRFKCKCCGSADGVLLLPTYRPKEESPVTWERVLVGWFHNQRAERKKERRKG